MERRRAVAVAATTVGLLMALAVPVGRSHGLLGGHPGVIAHVVTATPAAQLEDDD